MLKKLIFVQMIVMLLSFCSLSVDAEQPYASYTYNYWGEAVEAPQAYIPEMEITGESLGIDGFSNPTDIYVDPDKNIYLVDSGNNRIICMDENMKILRIVDGYEKDGKKREFNQPHGVFVVKSGDMYISDTDNGKIVVLDKAGNFVREIGRPETDLLPPDFVYKPTRIALDKALRIYVVAQNVNEGIIELDADGIFRAFIGATKVTPNPVDLFYKMVATREQRNRMQLFVPTEYNSIYIDDEGFIWGTLGSLDQYDLYSAILSRSQSERTAAVKRLNSTGTDVLRRNGVFPPYGDVDVSFTGNIQGPSSIIDIVVDRMGTYSILDSKRGRVFTYDDDGNLMFVFGGLGNRLGTFGMPSSIEKLEDKLLVTDSKRGSVILFGLTDYGKCIANAIKEYKNGNYEAASKTWAEALKYNANFEFAYQGMGKCSLREKRYSEAMRYFKLANDRFYYSNAFRFYRKAVIKKYFGVFAIFIILALLAYKLIRNYMRPVKIRRRGFFNGIDS